MFKEEIKKLRNQVAKTLIYHNKLVKLQNKINELERANEILYIGYYSKGTYYIYETATRQLEYILNQKIGYQAYNLDFNKNGNKKAFKENCQKLLNYCNKDVLENLKANKDKISINGNNVEILLHSSYLSIILNCLNILANNEIESEEVLKKVEEVLKTDNTFIYRDIKISVYKKGSIKMTFANTDLKKKFTDLLKEE